MDRRYTGPTVTLQAPDAAPAPVTIPAGVVAVGGLMALATGALPWIAVAVLVVLCVWPHRIADMVVAARMRIR